MDNRKLDEVARKIDRVALLKIDTEGADASLEGAENSLRQKRIKHRFFEANPIRIRQLGMRLGEAEELSGVPKCSKHLSSTSLYTR